MKPADLATSEAAYEAWNDAVLRWGQRGWDTVGRLCGWHRLVDPTAKLDCGDQ